MDVTLRHCNCLKGPTSRVKDMLVAEGFAVRSLVVKRPMTLQVNVNGKQVWSWALWRRHIPDQKTLAKMIRDAAGGSTEPPEA